MNTDRWNRRTAAIAASVLATFSVAGTSFAQTVSAPGATSGAPQSLFLFSPVGPGAGNGTIGMGGRIYLIIPTFDLNYVRGFSDSFDFILNVNTLGIVTFSDIGVRLRPLGDADSGFSLGLKAAATPAVFFIAVGDGAAGAVAFGATPGIVASFGSRTTQFSLGLDVPIFFGSAGFATGNESGTSGASSDVTPTLRPAATIEFSAGQTTNMYVQAAAYIAVANGGGFFGPVIAVGAAW